MASLKNLGFSDSLVEDYADFYFRGFTVGDANKKKVEEMRKNEGVHKSIQRFMECCAEVQKCNMDNKFYNEQREKYANKGKNAPESSGGNNEELLKENKWLNERMEELQ